MPTPEPPRPTDPLTVVDSINHALADCELGPDAMRWTTEADTLPDPDPGVLLNRQLVAISIDGRRLVVFDMTPAIEGARRAVEAMATMARTFARSFQAAMPALERLVHDLVQHQHGRARCPRCNPKGNPPPLAIDGHAYHRRTAARRPR